MINQDIYDLLDKEMPFNTALGFDNVGLLVGNMQDEVAGVVVCLDITTQVVNYAKNVGANLIVSHHPVIFDPVKSVDSNSILYKLIQNNMSAIACHTNFDLCKTIGVNCVLAEKLGFEDIFVPENKLYFQTKINKISTADFAKYIKEKFPQREVHYSNVNKQIANVAFCSGAGGSDYWDLASDVDAFITGEVKHDLWVDAVEKNIAVFALGHFETEQICVPYMVKYLQKNVSKIKIEFLENEQNPVKYL